MSAKPSQRSNQSLLAPSTRTSWTSWTSRVSSRSSSSFRRIKEGIQLLWAPQRCDSCTSLDLGSTTDSTYSKESTMIFDFQKFQSQVPRCPLCTLILHRIPSFRMLGSASNEPVSIQFKVKGHFARVFAEGRHIGNIRPVRIAKQWLRNPPLVTDDR
jgi:hypothetical protein